MGFYEAERLVTAKPMQRGKGMPAQKDVRAGELPAVSLDEGKTLHSISGPNLISAFCNSRG